MLKRGMPPVHPGEILKEMYLEPINFSITDLAENLGLARRTVSLLVNGHSGISAGMALRLSKAFNTTPELWMNMQRNYDLWFAAKEISLDKIRYIKSGKNLAA